MNGGAECTTSEILEFTRVPGSQLKSVVPYHTSPLRRTKQKISTSINRLELNKTHIIKGIEQVVQIQKDSCFACKDVFKGLMCLLFQSPPHIS